MPDDSQRTRAARAEPGRPPRLAGVLLAMFVAGGAAAFAAREARAEDARSVVFVSEGPEGDAVVSRLASRLPSRYVAADARAFRAALARGAPSPLTAALKSRGADADLVARARTADSDAHVDVAVLVQVRKSKRATLVHVWVVDAHSGDGAAIDRDVPLGAAASPGDVAESTWSAIEGAFPADVPSPAPPSAPSPPSAAPAPAEEPARGADVPEADVAPRPAGDDAPSLVHLGASLQGGSRHFSYVDRLTPTLRPYDLFLSPLVAIHVDVDPLARSREALLKGLGVTAEYARAFGLSAADSNGTRVSTTWQNYHIDLRDRIRVGDGAFVGLHAGFGGIDFSFDDTLAQAQLPSVAYRFVRAGADGQASVGELRIYGGASYLAVLSTGAVGDLFPRRTVGGVDAHIGLAHSIARRVDMSLELAYTRFFYTLHPEPGDSFVAGGALDEMASVSLGVTYGF